MIRGLRYHLGPVSHVLAGVLPLIWYAVLADVTPHLGLVLLCVVFALLPDLDSAASHIGRLFPWLSRPLERRFGHRTVTHSLLATGAVGLVTFLLFRDGWAWLTTAYASHLVLDMLVGEQGVPLLWPGPWRFYLASVRPAATGELVVTLLLLASCVLPLLWPTAAASAAGIVPRPPQPTSTPTPTPTPAPTPETIVVRIPHVYDPDTEILVRVGDVVAPGELLADLTIYRAIIATPAPLVEESSTSGRVDPLELAQASFASHRAGGIPFRLRPALRAGLKYPVVFAHCLHHEPPFADRERHGLLTIDVLPRLGGLDRDDPVPVFRRADDNRIDVLAIEDPAVVLVWLDVP